MRPASEAQPDVGDELERMWNGIERRLIETAGEYHGQIGLGTPVVIGERGQVAGGDGT